MNDIIVTVASGGTSATANVNYGAEIYAQRAEIYADECESWYGSVSSAGTSAVGSVSSATTESLGSITTATTNAVSSVNSAKASALSTITSAGTNVISSATAQATIATQQANLAKQYAEETHGQSDVMVENVRAIPAYTNYTYNQTETKGLADLKAWNRSTFDSSKFTVVGSPTITDDGIASGFSNSNYLNTPTLTVAETNFVVKININSYSSNMGEILFYLYNQNFVAGQSGFFLVQKFLNNLIGFVGGTGSTTTIGTVSIPDTTKLFDLELEFNETTQNLTIKAYQNNVLFDTLTNTYASFNFSSCETIYLSFGKYNNNGVLAIDLKQFLARIEGAEVFNGNKTGIDQIKKDNYSFTNSSVTATSEGIVSCIANGGYILPNTTASLTNTFTFENIFSVKGRFLLTNTTAPQFNILSHPFVIYKPAVGYITMWGGDISSPVYGTSINVNDYEGKWIDFVTTSTSSSTSVTFYHNGVSIGTITGAFGVSSPNKGAFAVDATTCKYDLNFFKIYTDDNLAYQATLKIPYNQTKTGVKIVDSYYRDRVQDMYDQFGWANYYTLSDTNFTVPQGENLNGHVVVVDWYKNGTTSWEYDTNLDCVETGSCTSGTAVTLPKAFSDTNYSLSVPYSAKTTTGFTPSATGEYIAKGKVVLG